MSMTSDYLASNFGVTIEQARVFLARYVADPGFLYEGVKKLGLNSTMLGEIVGVPAELVEAFFTAKGFDGAALRSVGAQPPVVAEPAAGGIPDHIYSFNQNEGALSTASLREQIIAISGVDAYNQVIFNVRNNDGWEDGLWTAEELDMPTFPTIAATAENIESIFYGTVINAIKTLDAQEIQELGEFTLANLDAINAGDPAAFAAAERLIYEALVDAAAVPVMDDAQLAGYLVQIVGTMVRDNPTASMADAWQVVLLP